MYGVKGEKNMLKNKVLKKVLSGMLVLAFLLQPMSFQAQEDLTKEATNVNILVQEPMNALFQQEEGKDATVENLEYSYGFDENKGEELTADVDVMIDMTVSGMAYEIEAEGEVSGEKLSSGTVNKYDYTNCYVVNIKFGILDSANFDDITCGMPIVFQLATENSGFTQDFTLKTTITYRTMVKVDESMGYAVCYESAQTATCGMNINVN